MSTLKTTVNQASVKDFINTVPDETKRKDSFILLKLFEKITGEKGKMWGSSIIGFGQYHYKSERSKQEGDWPLVGFSPRKQNTTIYLTSGFNDYQNILERLGKFKTSTGSCLYIKKLDDINIDVLEELIKRSFIAMKEKYT